MLLFSARCCWFGANLVHILTTIVAYHFDADNVILYENPAGNGLRGSYFGYTVALWNPGKGSSDGPWIFIGAPRANSSAYAEANEPGTVFKCKIGKRCGEWVMDSGNDNRPKNGSWLGGTMNVENKTNPEILVCGPRWINENYTRKSPRIIRSGIPGMCYWATARNFSNSRQTVKNPFLQPKTFFGQHSEPMQQVGFSMHMIPDFSPLEFVLGSPRPLNKHGTLIRSDRLAGNFIIPQPNQSGIDEVDYYGYAVTSGKYFGDRKRIYATGAPRSRSLYGKVDLLDFPQESKIPVEIHLTEEGEQIGEYFGSTLASCDVDGDERDDLLVGAPQWSETLDEGRIYVLRGTKSRLSKEFKIRDKFKGRTPRGRFGSAITCLGDIDYDGYADVAVGAPYDGNGAVYIFHGGKDGLRLSQIIAGPERTKGFGISISEPRDIDNNGYADIAVGAYLSDHVTLIRSKRIVATTVTISTDLSGGQLNLTTEVFSITVCSSYTGAYAPQELNITRELKIDEMYGRAEVEIDGEYFKTYKHSETLKSRVPKTCRDFRININKTENFDYLNPLDISVSQRLDTIQKNSTYVVGSDDLRGQDNFNNMDTVMNGSDQAVINTRKIQFKVKCGNDTCRSNLSVEILTDLDLGTPFLIGSRPDLQLFVKVRNFGENAYLAKAFVDIPIFIGILKLQSMCVKYSKKTTHMRIMCDAGNPLARNETRTFSVHLDMSEMPLNHTHIEFAAVATTSSEDESEDNEKSHSIDTAIAADIGITGSADMDWNSYMQPGNKESLPNMMFRHIYKIRNHDVTPLSEALLSISFPTHWVDADEKIEIVKLNNTVGDLDGRKINCKRPDEDSDIFSVRYDATLMPEWLLGENSSKSMSQTQKKFMVIDGKVFGVSPDNRTLYINTSNPSVEWETIDCLIGPFRTARSAAKIVLTFDLLLSNLPSELLNKKDIIFFASNGSTKITVPPDFIQTVNHKPDVVMIGTMFVGSTSGEQKVATWVIALSVAVGLLLLMLLVFALCKFGFFKRSKKAKLEALMAQRGKVISRALNETTSSTEALDNT